MMAGRWVEVPPGSWVVLRGAAVVDMIQPVLLWTGRLGVERDCSRPWEVGGVGRPMTFLQHWLFVSCEPVSAHQS
jgi:hypothetical protein